MKILLIEENKPTCDLVEKYFDNDKSELHIADYGEVGILYAASEEFDVIILASQLSDMSGHEIIKRLRHEGVVAPILFLSNLNVVDERIKALSNGADDFLAKPFNSEELVAKVKALARRAHGQSNNEIHIGKLTIIPALKIVKYEDTLLPIRGKQYEILEFLCHNKNRIITLDRLAEHMYHDKGEKEATHNTLKVMIALLRKKLGSYCEGKRFLVTRWGIGYTIEDSALH